MRECIVHPGEGEVLGPGFDAVPGGELQHRADRGGCADGRPGDRPLGHDEWERGEVERFKDRADHVQPAARGERLDVGIPVEGHIDGGDDEVEPAAGARNGVEIARVDGFVGAEFQRFLLFGFAGGEGGDMTPPRPGELEREMSEAADADDGDLRCGRELGLHERVEDGDAAAEHRADGARRDGCGQLHDAGGLRADDVGEAAMTADDGCLCCCTHVMVATQALPAMQAVAGVPAEADAITDVEVLHARPDGADAAGHLMARNQGVIGHAPVVLEHAEIAVADATMFNIDVNFIITDRAERVGEWFKRFPRCRGGEGVNGGGRGHVRWYQQ